MSLEQLRALVKSVLRLPGKSDAAVEKDASAFLIGESAAMDHVRQLIEKLSRSQRNNFV